MRAGGGVAAYGAGAVGGDGRLYPSGQRCDLAISENAFPRAIERAGIDVSTAARAGPCASAGSRPSSFNLPSAPSAAPNLVARTSRATPRPERGAHATKDRESENRRTRARIRLRCGRCRGRRSQCGSRKQKRVGRRHGHHRAHQSEPVRKTGLVGRDHDLAHERRARRPMQLHHAFSRWNATQLGPTQFRGEISILP